MPTDKGPAKGAGAGTSCAELTHAMCSTSDAAAHTLDDLRRGRQDGVASLGQLEKRLRAMASQTCRPPSGLIVQACPFALSRCTDFARKCGS